MGSQVLRKGQEREPMIISLTSCSCTFNPAPGRHWNRFFPSSPVAFILPLPRFSLWLLRATGSGVSAVGPRGRYSQPPAHCVLQMRQGEERTYQWPAGRCTSLEESGAHLCPTQADPWWSLPATLGGVRKSLICSGLK